MENKLKQLFDFQRFENNPRLAKVISDAEACGEALSDDDLFMVAAAGEPLFDFKDEEPETEK